MEKTIIKFSDGIEIEVENTFEEDENSYGEKKETSAYLDKQYHTNRTKEKELDVSFKEVIKEKLSAITEAITDVWIDINKEKLKASKTSVEFGLNFNAEKNFVIAKFGAGAFFKINVEWDFDKIETNRP